MKSEKNPRGAGRKKLDDDAKKQKISTSLKPWLIKKLRECPGKQSQIVEYALIKYFNLIE
jgi:hypothetical protein